MQLSSPSFNNSSTQPKAQSSQGSVIDRLPDIKSLQGWVEQGVFKERVEEIHPLLYKLIRCDSSFERVASSTLRSALIDKTQMDPEHQQSAFACAKGREDDSGSGY